MRELFLTILGMSATAAIAACAVMLLRLPLKKAPKIFSYVLWAVVLFRLVCPLSFESAFAVMPSAAEALPRAAQVPVLRELLTNAAPESGLPTAAASMTPGDAQPSVDFPEIAAYVWAAGTALMLVYALFSYIKMKMRLSTAVRISGNVYETDRILSPFVLGLLRPRIYLPAGAANEGYILRHERAHIRRCDHLVKFVSFAALCVHWFNPVIWLSYRLMCRDMEMSCDESVLRHYAWKDIRRAYSGSLLQLAVKRSGLPGPLAFGESDTKSRVRNVLSYRKPALWLSVLSIVLVLAATACFASDQAVLPNPEAEPQTSPSVSIPLIAQPDVTPQPAATPEASPAPDPVASPAFFDTLPPAKDLAVTREGLTELLPARLVISDKGYAIYLLEDFELVSDGETDTIKPTEVSSLNPRISVSLNVENLLKLVRSLEGVTPSYLMDQSELMEGGLVLMHTMLDTIVLEDGTTREPSSEAAKYLGGEEGRALLTVAEQAVADHLKELGMDFDRAYVVSRSLELSQEFDSASVYYELLLQGNTDKYDYATMEMAKTDGVWSVTSIGLEG